MVLFLLAIIILACGPKKEVEVCAGKIRKEFNHGGIYATVEEGCVVKYEKSDEFKASGKVNLKITPDGKKKTIHLPKGKINSNDGEFLIEGDLKTVKIRLIRGTGSATVGSKEVQLILNNVLTIGG